MTGRPRHRKHRKHREHHRGHAARAAGAATLTDSTHAGGDARPADTAPELCRPHARSVLLIAEEPDAVIPVLVALAAAPHTRFSLYIAESATRALRRLREQPDDDPFDAVLFDVSNRSGPWPYALTRLGFIHPRLPMLALVPDRSPEMGERARELGAAGSVDPRSATPGALEAAIDDAVDRAPRHASPDTRAARTARATSATGTTRATPRASDAEPDRGGTR